MRCRNHLEQKDLREFRKWKPEGFLISRPTGISNRPTARRIYRFLDKRFGLGQSQWTFDLEKFAYNKIGLGKDSYSDLAQVKRQLSGAIKQLEEVRFIMPCSPKRDLARFREESGKCISNVIVFRLKNLCLLSSMRSRLRIQFGESRRGSDDEPRDFLQNMEESISASV